jgi:hypothetical protein
MGESNNRRPLNELIIHSKVRQAVEDAGYKFIALPSAFLFTQIRDADIYLTYAKFQVSDFEGLLLSKSLAGPMIEMANIDIPLVNYETERKSILFTLDMLGKMPSQPGPKFVFAHILSPHHPFVFDENGNPLQTDQPYFIGGQPEYYGSPQEYSAMLARETSYLDSRLEDVITAILEKSHRPPIIIIHGDHGPGALTNFISLDRNCLSDRFSILNAYYYPEQKYDGL